MNEKQFAFLKKMLFVIIALLASLFVAFFAALFGSTLFLLVAGIAGVAAIIYGGNLYFASDEESPGGP